MGLDATSIVLSLAGYAVGFVLLFVVIALGVMEGMKRHTLRMESRKPGAVRPARVAERNA